MEDENMILTDRMRISSIEISRLAGSEKAVKYDLNTDVNIFFGDNGSGKTSLLKILHSASSNETTELTDVPFERARVIIDYFGTFRLERSIVNSAFNKKVEAPASATGLPDLSNLLSSQPTLIEPIKWESIMFVKLKDDFQPYEPEEKADYILRHQYLPTTRLYLGLEKKNAWENRQLTEQELEQNFGKRITELWKEYNYDLSNTKADIQGRGLAGIMKDIWSSGDQKKVETELDLERAYDRVNKFFERQDLTDILTSLDDFKSRIANQPYLMNVIKDINGVEEAIEKALIPKTKLVDLVTKLYGDKLSLKFEEKQITVITKGGKEIALGTLSSGQKQLLMIFLSALMADNKPILIDEPEISMHVNWQSGLVDAIRQLSPSTQIILATHSPEIAASVDDDKLFRL
jgi:ABC-type lipoprotein export system ATPase subunit